MGQSNYKHLNLWLWYIIFKFSVNLFSLFHKLQKIPLIYSLCLIKKLSFSDLESPPWCKTSRPIWSHSQCCRDFRHPSCCRQSSFWLSSSCPLFNGFWPRTTLALHERFGHSLVPCYREVHCFGYHHNWKPTFRDYSHVRYCRIMSTSVRRRLANGISCLWYRSYKYMFTKVSFSGIVGVFLCILWKLYVSDSPTSTKDITQEELERIHSGSGGRVKPKVCYPESLIHLLFWLF